MLTLPGHCLDVSLLINKRKKYRTRGGREGALDAMKNLEEKELGKLVVKKSKGSIKVCHEVCAFVYVLYHMYLTLLHVTVLLDTSWEFQKTRVPNDQEGQTTMAKLLATYNVSLLDHVRNFASTDVTHVVVLLNV